MLRNDWDAVCTALGIAQAKARTAPRLRHVRGNCTRRAIMIRMDVPQKRAAA
jgi:hypothetical protein